MIDEAVLVELTDAKDAAVIANQARMRHDLQPLHAGDQTRDGLRRTRVARTAAWLRKHKAYNTSAVAATALEAAISLHTVVPGQDLAATGDDMNVFGTTERLAAISELAPVPRDHKLYQPTTPNAAAA